MGSLILVVAAAIWWFVSPSVKDITGKVKMGMSQREVENVVGKPDHRQEFNQAGADLGDGVTVPGSKDTLWYYYTGIPHVWNTHSIQIAFGTEGKVSAVNVY